MFARMNFTRTIGVLTWLLAAHLPVVGLAGFEDFANFPETENSYVDGTFRGQDGSTWSYVSCQGSKVIDAPTPGMGKGKTPPAQIESGTLSGGCGALSFEYKQLYTATVAVDVVCERYCPLHGHQHDPECHQSDRRP